MEYLNNYDAVVPEIVFINYSIPGKMQSVVLMRLRIIQNSAIWLRLFIRKKSLRMKLKRPL